MKNAHGIWPMYATIATPLLVNIPLLITMSLGVRQAMGATNSPVAVEQLLWMANLAEPDMTLSLMAGLTAYSIAELMFKPLNKPGMEEAPGTSDAVKKLPVPPLPRPPVGQANYLTHTPAPPPPPMKASGPKRRSFTTSTSDSSAPSNSVKRSLERPQLVDVDPKSQAIAPAERKDSTRRIIGNAVRVASVVFFCLATSMPAVSLDPDLRAYWSCPLTGDRACYFISRVL